MVSAAALMDFVSFGKDRQILESPEHRENMVTTHYEITTHHYSFAMLYRYLNRLLTNFLGVNFLRTRSSDKNHTGICESYTFFPINPNG